MDLVAGMLVRELDSRHRVRHIASLLRPQFVRRFSRARGGGEKKYLFNADRLLNRFFDYPRFLRARKNKFDLFHIVDHSYSHLAMAVGSERSVVTCHDLDTFRCIVEPHHAARSVPHRVLARPILRGLRSAAAIACVSAATRDEILRYRIAPAERVSVNPNGVTDIFTTRPDACAEAEVCRFLGAPNRDRLEIAHVGSTIPRKRIDVLIRVATAVRGAMPSVHLVRVGGTFTPSQRKLINELALPVDAVSVLPFVSPAMLASVYRRAALTLLPSESEGFGLPVLESLACGTPVLLSDIPSLREIGGPSAAFCPVADVGQWTQTILDLLNERRRQPHTWAERTAVGQKWARRFTWEDYADRTIQLYDSVAPIH